MKRKLAYQVCYVIAALWATHQAASAAGIATVVDVVNDGYRTPPGADETTAKPTDELVQNEALRTEEESVIQVKFVDGSELSVEQSSEMVLSDYVYDGTASSGLINLNNGLFHFTSNGNNDQGVKLRTPVATIGVRGTEFLVHVDRDEATIIDILAGAVAAIPHGLGKEITCYEGQSILIASEDDDAQCGDIGSFSTAAGPGPDSKGPEGGTHGGNGDKEKEPKEPPSPPSTEPEPEPEPEPELEPEP
ncbi:MAG: FecR family protein [Dongiaceae bacterium]